MKTSTGRLVSVVTLTLAAWPQRGWAQEPDAHVAADTKITIHMQAETSLATTYVFRGAPQYLRKTVPSSQTTLALGWDNLGPGSLSLVLWNATALTDFGDQGGTQLEFDAQVAYSMPLGDRFEGSLGYTAFLYPEMPDGSPIDAAHEIDVGLSMPTKWVTPSLAVHADSFRQKGAYAALAVARDFGVNKLTVSPAVSVGVSDYRGVSAGLHDVTGTVGARYTLTENIYFGGSGNVAYNGRADANASTLWASVYFGIAN